MRLTPTTILLLSTAASANNDDRFNYRGTDDRDFGPEHWNRVQCDDVGECLGWPDGWELGVGWELKHNNCEWCPDGEQGNDCSIHRQSPINLERTRSTTGHDPECYDYHWMAYQDGTCNWHDMVKNGYSEDENNFKINRHSLQINQPIDEHGELQCGGPRGRKFPRLDYSKGFPDWWFLSHTEVTVPSEHTQGGKHYDAEVHLAHFYSVDHERKVGKVALFLEADPDRERWDFLDKLICQWREVEEKTRDECGLESVPAYPGCRNPTREDSESDLPVVDPYPFIDCDSVENSERMCKPSSCCEAERSTGGYCQNDVYDKYDDETVGSICWWCCPGKLLGPAEGEPNLAPFLEPTPTPSHAPSNIFLAPIKPSLAPTQDSDITSSSPTTVYEMPTPTPSQAPSNIFLAPIELSLGPTQDSDIPSSSPTVDETTLAPIQVSTLAPIPPAPAPAVVCSDYDGHPEIRLKQICEDGGCCDPVRSSTDHCHATYKFFGASMGSVCSDCCNPSKELAPLPPPHPIYPEIDCTAVDNPFRICKPTSCCNEKRSTTAYCKDTYEEYGEMMGSICWHCCSEPKEVDPSVLPPSLPTTQAPAGPSVSPTPTTLDSSLYPTQPLPFTVVCSDYDGHPDIRLKQICEDGGCCDPVRSSTDHCHATYKFFGDTMESVCSDCCNPSKELTPPAPPHPIYPEIDCTTVKNPFRICKPTSCCNQEKSTTGYCEDTYEEYGETMGSICWHCCSEPKEVDPSVLPPSPPYTPPPTYDAMPSSAPSISPTSVSPTITLTAAAPSADTYGHTASPHPSESDTPWPTPRFGKTFSPTVSPSTSNTASGHPTDAPSATASPTVSEISSNQPSGAPAVAAVSSNPSGVPSAGSTFSPTVSPSASNTVSGHPSDAPSVTVAPTVSENAPSQPSGTPSVAAVSNIPSGIPSEGSATPVYIGACPEPPDGGCSICGPELCVGNADAIFSFPGQPAVPCGVLQDAGYNGLISLDQCPFLPLLITDCECGSLGVAAAPPAEPTDPPASSLATPLPTPPTSSALPSSSEAPSTDSSEAPSTEAQNATSNFSCDAYIGFPEANFNRICSDKDSGCCNAKRSATRFCHRAYNIFGDNMGEACSQCCDPPKQVAPPPEPHPIYPPTDCAVPDNTARICRSCCDPTMSTTSYCKETYLSFTESIGSICWYCCSDSMELDPAALNFTASPSTAPSVSSTPSSEPSSAPSDLDKASRRGLRQVVPNEEHSSGDSSSLDELTEATDVLLPSGMWASDLIMDPVNFEEPENLEEEYVASIEAYRKRQEDASSRLLQQEDPRRRLSEGSESGDNYINVPYSPYEWLREVKTEYYYRYEGTQMVPPCYETVHYRIMKDPIRIHPDQLAELERLLAWRTSPKGSEFNECERDTAGRERPGSNGDAVDLNRPLQSYHNIHRKVFCECGDWTSKWQEDRDWCEMDDDARLRTQPYNFPTPNGFNM